MNFIHCENPFVRKAAFHLEAMKCAYEQRDQKALAYHDEQCRIATQRVIIWAYTNSLCRDFIVTPGGRDHD